MNISLMGQLAAAALVLLLIILCLLKGEKRRRFGNFALIIVTLFVFSFVAAAFGPTGRMSKPNLAVGADTAEMQLRIYSCLETIEKNTINAVPQALKSSRQGGDAEREKIRQRRLAYDRVESALEAAINDNTNVQNNSNGAAKTDAYKTKLAIVLLIDDNEKNRKRVSDIAGQLQESVVVDYRTLGYLLESLAVGKAIPADRALLFERAIEKTVPKGWYRNELLLSFYPAIGDKPAESKLMLQVKNQNLAVFYKLTLFIAIAVVSALVGVINIAVQIALYFRSKSHREDRIQSESQSNAVGLDIPLKSVYAVFVSWFAYYIIASMIFHKLLTTIPALTSQPILVAASTGLVYLLGSLPAPFLIYHLALKPRQLPFWSSLGISPDRTSNGRDKPQTNGLRLDQLINSSARLAACGYLGWCSIFPIIGVAVFLATRYLGTQGSDNPVIAQIVQAANSSNIPTIILFYLTLGVLAPFFEELLFRGFLYSALKRKLGVPLSMVISSALFACLHFDKGGVLMLFAIGMVLTATFERCRNLIPSMIAHGLWNSGSFTVTLILFSL